MKITSYHIVKKIHLYASLSIVILLVMYVLSSYFMIHYDFFKTYDWDETEIEMVLESAEFSEEKLQQFLSKNAISGKLINENLQSSGDWTRKYSRAGNEHVLRFYADESILKITTRQAKLPGFIVGLHRIRGFEGPWQYIVYGVLLDVVGISLILFAVTGAILWMKLLKNDWIAWVVFGAGFLYVASILAYLLIV